MYTWAMPNTCHQYAEGELTDLCDVTRVVIICGFKGLMRHQEADSAQDLETTIEKRFPHAQTRVYQYLDAEALRPGWVRYEANKILEDLLDYFDDSYVSPRVLVMHSDPFVNPHRTNNAGPPRHPRTTEKATTLGIEMFPQSS